MRRFLFRLFLLVLSVLPFPSEAQEVPEVPLWWEHALGYTQLPIGRMFETVGAACKTVTEKSLMPISAREFAFAAVKSLSTIDQKIHVRMDGKRVLILIDGKIMKSFPAPEENDCPNWSRLALTAAVEVRPYSAKAQNADAEEFFNIFINAALGTLDPYSHYDGADPAEPETLAKPAGIGIGYRRVGRYLEITQIVSGGAASRTDLAIGDRIFAINGKRVADLSHIQTLNLLRGEEGTEVLLQLRKDGKITTRTIVRTPAERSPVSFYFDEKDRLMTVKVDAFTEKTVAGLKFTMKEAKTSNAVGLIIDLRGNTGGLLKEAVLAADIFLPPDLLMIQTNGRHPEAQYQYISTKKEFRPVLPIVILIDSRTASGAEYFAGILQFYRHAVLIGTPSYGKGVIQMNETLPDNGELYLTWSQFYFPNRFSPQGMGLYPNLCTSGRTLLNIDELPSLLSNMRTWYGVGKREPEEEQDQEEEKSELDQALEQVVEQNRKKAIEEDLAKCPRQPRQDDALDPEVARELLMVPEAYQKALTSY